MIDQFLIPFFCGTCLMFGIECADKGERKFAMFMFGTSLIGLVTWIGKYA